MPPMEPKVRKNDHELPQAYMQHVLELLRAVFAEAEYHLPDNLRGELAFPHTGTKGQMLGEWISPEAAGGYHQIIIRNALDDPKQIICIAAAECIHAVLGTPERKKDYRDVAAGIGFDVSNGVRSMLPKKRLQDRLNAIVEALGPIPHKAFDYDKIRVKGKSTLKPKQSTRQLKAECIFVEGGAQCGFLVRVSAGQARDIGPPHCSRHGAMYVHWPDGEEPVQPEDGITIDGTAEDLPDQPRLEAAE